VATAVVSASPAIVSLATQAVVIASTRLGITPDRLVQMTSDAVCLGVEIGFEGAECNGDGVNAGVAIRDNARRASHRLDDLANPLRRATRQVDDWFSQTRVGRLFDECVGQNSFSADTDVSTPDGDRPISEIEVGDTVYAYNESTGEVGEYEVTATINHVDEDIIHLYLDGELIETTAEHPFYTEDEVWVDAADLTAGDQILSLDGDYGTVERVVVVEDANQPMYNLTVDEAHTFYIGEGDWLVHNVDCDFWLSGNFSKIADTDLPTSIKADPFSAMARYDADGNLRQMGFYDADGNIIYHIDAPDGHTPSWHWHDFTSTPGDPSSGHGPGAAHNIIGDDSALEEFLNNAGFDFDDWKEF
jgi:hypothetical protein